ncbi:sll1630 [Synechocystis sp. PCC 6803]|uniref:Sll1630 protein n=1 Tax=Synechocystis sp. (strain ATCC 27184 / PCC 6803 / Kazusa) TaxID=1111708 RepID=P73718_SYNY3|nr:MULTISPECIES: DUF29 family protein [unclassified Synechocystis]BAM51516.1 hypothetical protein BEST7613_2585 [Synechocystis sp. PCC 6803] [Bacillus subtilis BEST7613]AGF51453.1 hypothetical protein MYO_111990 [Synechocystis sp. PCC 6803]ALJ67456.1 hypothetical protein AOY38_06145 [Synechocystis sp. PCC 6803]AVP89304.1 DUF29 domain-containing protein [Synechocystis sp. IPPAS B-1465]MBD2617490.1 DUF29 family protein [Synechocystis sp. FACHB-898]
MEELLELKQLVQSGQTTAALALIDELETMSKEDKINKIYSYCVVLLIHLIKQQAEARSTNSWEVSIRNAINAIERINKRRKAGCYYVSQSDLQEILAEADDRALDNASLEAFGGIYNAAYLAEKVDRNAIISQAIKLISFA